MTNMTHPHTTSLEHSKKLADACQKMGVEMPESYFWWHDGCSTWSTPHLKEKNHSCIGKPYRALTLGELMRMLRNASEEGDLHLEANPNGGGWGVLIDCYKDQDYLEVDTPENAACELLTELILSGKVKTLV